MRTVRWLQMENNQALVLANWLNSRLNDAERDAAIVWLRRLLDASHSKGTRAAKIKPALTLTRSTHVVMPIATMIGKEVKRLGWDERSWPARLGMGGALAAAAIFGGEGAGIAAFSTGVGVPLWIVMGAGASFAGVLLEELERARGEIGAAKKRSSDPEQTRAVMVS